MDVKELYRLVQEYYGYKADMRSINTETQEVNFFLYDSFSVICSVGDHYGCFGAGIVMPDGQLLTSFLGKECSLNSDSDSICKSLKIIDDYCRMRLPDKYLEAFEQCHKDDKPLISGPFVPPQK